MTILKNSIASISEELKDDYEKALAFVQEKQAKNKAAISAYEKGDWTPLYEYQLFENQFANEELDTGIFRSEDLKKDIGKMAIVASMEEKKWLLKHHVQPVFSGEFIVTIFHYWDEAHAFYQKEWEEANRKVDSSGLFSLYLYFNQYFYFVPMILFFLLLGGGLATDTGKKSTLRFLMSQPLSLRHIFHGKVLSSFIVVLLSSTVIFASVLLIGTIFDRFGDWYYPILVYDSQSLANSANYNGTYVQGMGFHFTPLGHYLVKCIVLFLIVLLFLIILSTFCSLFIKNQLGVFMIVILLSASGYVLSIEALSEVAHLSPFTYFNIVKIINGEVSTVHNNPHINFMTGSIVLFISSFVVMTIGHVVLRKYKNLTA